MRRPDFRPHSFLLNLSAGLLIPGFLLVTQTNPKLESAYNTASEQPVTLAQQEADTQAKSLPKAEAEQPCGHVARVEPSRTHTQMGECATSAPRRSRPE